MLIVSIGIIVILVIMVIIVIIVVILIIAIIAITVITVIIVIMAQALGSRRAGTCPTSRPEAASMHSSSLGWLPFVAGFRVEGLGLRASLLWRPRGLSKWVISRVIRTRNGVTPMITLLITDLLSPLGLQVGGFRICGFCA